MLDYQPPRYPHIAPLERAVDQITAHQRNHRHHRQRMAGVFHMHHDGEDQGGHQPQCQEREALPAEIPSLFPAPRKHRGQSPRSHSAEGPDQQLRDRGAPPAVGSAEQAGTDRCLVGHVVEVGADEIHADRPMPASRAPATPAPCLPSRRAPCPARARLAGRAARRLPTAETAAGPSPDGCPRRCRSQSRSTLPIGRRRATRSSSTCPPPATRRPVARAARTSLRSARTRDAAPGSTQPRTRNPRPECDCRSNTPAGAAATLPSRASVNRMLSARRKCSHDKHSHLHHEERIARRMRLAHADIEVSDGVRQVDVVESE